MYYSQDWRKGKRPISVTGSNPVLTTKIKVMNYTLEKKCHAWIGIWWQVKEDKEIVFKSKRKKDCVFYMNSKI